MFAHYDEIHQVEGDSNGGLDVGTRARTRTGSNKTIGTIIQFVETDHFVGESD